MSEKKKTIYRKDYLPPNCLVESIDLSFNLGEDVTVVESSMHVKRNGSVADDAPLYLYGRELALKSVTIDGKRLEAERYLPDGEGLTIHDVPKTFRLEIVTEIKPQENVSLEGLYKSSGNFCTQCEAEGFRKITYYPDRPDVMAMFTTTITADKTLSHTTLIRKPRRFRRSGRWPPLCKMGGPFQKALLPLCPRCR